MRKENENNENRNLKKYDHDKMNILKKNMRSSIWTNDDNGTENKMIEAWWYPKQWWRDKYDTNDKKEV